MTLNGITFALSQAESSGAALQIYSTTPRSVCTFRNCVIRDNQHGGVYGGNSDAVFINCRFLNNSGGAVTGAFFFHLSFTNCTFSGNHNGGYARAIVLSFPNSWARLGSG